uniref:Putative secreted protein n=1 Tax=Anopheles darlingi TaxID=43151 RepID=A0A2M4D844_ANODA
MRKEEIPPALVAWFLIAESRSKPMLYDFTFPHHLGAPEGEFVTMLSGGVLCARAPHARLLLSGKNVRLWAGQ